VSTLKRLYDYAKVATSEPLENFTTEALAGAIRADPAPILDALGRRGIIAPDLVRDVAAFTQVYVSVADRYGYLDLMLQLELPPGPHEVWFENKTGSPEGVGQLAFYRAVIDANAADGVERHLVALAPYAISRDQHHVFVSWQEVATAARMHATSPFWHDLVEFLEEIGMTEESTLPVTAREAAAVTDAHRLFTKTKAVLTRVNAWAREHITDWPGDAWWKDGQIRGGMLRQFAEKGRFTP
jgi:hypothetical protein